MFLSWLHNLENLNTFNEVNTFLDKTREDYLQFMNINAEIIKALQASNRELEELIKQNNEVIISTTEYDHKLSCQKIKENYELIKQNRKILNKMYKIESDLHDKFLEIYQDAVEMLGNLVQQELQQERQQQQEQQERQQQQRNTDLHQGLSLEIIEKISIFTADESHVGDQCSICMEDFEIGRNMMSLDCDGKHAFCQVCIEGCFADHNTCPLCRHMFE